MRSWRSPDHVGGNSNTGSATGYEHVGGQTRGLGMTRIELRIELYPGAVGYKFVKRLVDRGFKLGVAFAYRKSCRQVDRGNIQPVGKIQLRVLALQTVDERFVDEEAIDIFRAQGEKTCVHVREPHDLRARQVAVRIRVFNRTLHYANALVLDRRLVAGDRAIGQGRYAKQPGQITLGEIDHLEPVRRDRDRPGGEIDLLVRHTRQQAAEILRTEVDAQSKLRTNRAQQLHVEAGHLAVVDVGVRLVVSIHACHQLARRKRADVVGIGAGSGHQREGSDERSEAEKVSKPHDVAPGKTSD